ncbi:FadR/GntR family transcriptional regulator [Actinocrispum wychmicini]|uniref:GntR family uxuAB operon transcriptional repressor n=1 Tax=Actinocrispum wychmicini TaxID=1213861 RepID=A0A4R2JRT9_9PSEU|nr:GntR family transcriptional regulator [Actinocrispum wychmicini]TCO59579.1 GntR family uxuAB operon transcriptional repressor [Actinocrispum wychmicini]
MSSGTQRARVADQLLRDIRAGRYEAGARLPSERQMSEALGVSRPVVREALGMLSSLGLVDVQIGRGAFVTAKDVTVQSQNAQRSLIDVTVVREVLESGALELAARRDPSEVDIEPVRAALAELERCVERGTHATAADHELHRAIVASARSATVLRLWDEHTQEISNVIRISPSGGTMDESTLDRHRTLANGLLTGDAQAALAACHDLHEDYRRFLRDLLD